MPPLWCASSRSLSRSILHANSIHISGQSSQNCESSSPRMQQYRTEAGAQGQHRHGQHQCSARRRGRWVDGQVGRDRQPRQSGGPERGHVSRLRQAVSIRHAFAQAASLPAIAALASVSSSHNTFLRILLGWVPQRSPAPCPPPSLGAPPHLGQQRQQRLALDAQALHHQINHLAQRHAAVA